MFVGGSGWDDPGMDIRPATVADAPAIAEVHVLSWQSGYRGLLPQEMLDGLDVAQRVERWTRTIAAGALPRDGTLVAERDGALLAFANLGPTRDDDRDPDRTGQIRSFYVRPDAWRGGIGQRLMSEVLRSLAAAGFRTASLWVLEGNHRAARFYSACGFTPDGAVKDDHLAGVDIRIVRYCRDLRCGAGT